MPARLVERSGQRQIRITRCGVGEAISAPPDERSRQHQQRHDHECDQASAPATLRDHQLAQRCAEERAHGAGGRNDTERQRASPRLYHARCDVGGNARCRAGQGHADKHAGTERQHQWIDRSRGRHKPCNVDHHPNERDPARAVAISQGAGEGLGDPPNDILHGDSHGIVSRGNAKVLYHRCLEQAERLPKPHRNARHDGSTAQHGDGLGPRHQPGMEGYATGVTLRHAHVLSSEAAIAPRPDCSWRSRSNAYWEGQT